MKAAVSEKNNIKPEYYGAGKFDVIDLAKMFDLNFNVGNIVKYIIRAGSKNPEKHIEDLEKAKEYLEREIHHVKSQKFGEV